MKTNNHLSVSLSANGLSDVTCMFPNTGATESQRRPIGFVHYGNFPAKADAHPVCDHNPLSGNPYFAAMMKAVQEFVNGELSGHAFTIDRLKEKMKAADTLFNAEHRDMERLYRSIRG